ncbi:Cupredoxin [Tricladium varicosporioides]|nr:Cupredoxin [Hymenoscyphus varicosporioides]
MQFSIFTVLSLASAVLAADPQIVKVGDGALAFSPSTITAAVGSTVEFRFYPMKHSVAQGTFESPCTPGSNTSFFSGGMATASGVNNMTFTLTIADDKPIYYYCAFPGHCGSGMVGIINPPSDTSKGLDAYVAAAKDKTTTPLTKVQGGTIAPLKVASNGTVTSASPSATKTSNGGYGGGDATTTPSATPKSAAGLSRGEVSWGVMGAIAGFVGLMI